MSTIKKATKSWNTYIKEAAIPENYADIVNASKNINIYNPQNREDWKGIINLFRLYRNGTIQLDSSLSQILRSKFTQVWNQLSANSDQDYDLISFFDPYPSRTKKGKLAFWNNFQRLEKKREAERNTPTISYDDPRRFRRKALRQPQRGYIDQQMFDLGKELNIGHHKARNALNTLTEFGLMFTDPSGQFAGFETTPEGKKRIVSAVEVFDDSVKHFKGDPGILNGGMVVLASLAFIPFLGGAATVSAKVGRRIQGPAKQIKSKVIQSAEEYADAAKQASITASAKGDKQAWLQEKIAEKIYNYTATLKGIDTKRIKVYLNSLNKQVTRKVMSGLRTSERSRFGGISTNTATGKTTRTNRVTKTTPKEFPPNNRMQFLFKYGDESPSSKKLNLSEIEVNIVIDVEKATTDSLNPVVKSGGYNTETQKIIATIYLDPRLAPVGPNGLRALTPKAYETVHIQVNRLNFHEMMHSRQFFRGQRGATDDAAKQLVTVDKNPGKYVDPAGSGYDAYRLKNPSEIEAWALEAAQTANKVRAGRPDTIDRMLPGYIYGVNNPRVGTFEEFVVNLAQKATGRPVNNVDLPKWVDRVLAGKGFTYANDPYHAHARFQSATERTIKQIKHIQGKYPCASITAQNAFILMKLGLLDPREIPPKYGKILRSVRNNPAKMNTTPIPIYPKGCKPSRKSVREALINKYWRN